MSHQRIAKSYFIKYTVNLREPVAQISQPRRVPLIFYRTLGGSEPVRDWLKELPEPECHAIGRDLIRTQWRWPIGMPLCRAMGSGLWEIRTDLPTKRIARVLICPCGSHLVVLHGFNQEDSCDAR
jgi:phage-related protein